MSPDLANRTLLRFVVTCLTCLPHLASAQVTTAYSFSQVNLNGSQSVLYEKSVSPAPAPPITEDADSKSTYDFALSGSTGPTSLSASASLNISIDHSSSAEVFDTVLATAQAKASYAQIGTVQGAVGFPGGTIVLQWTVDGTTALSLSTTGGIDVENISNTARLETNIPGYEIFEDFLDTPYQGGSANNVNFNASFPSALFDPVSFDPLVTFDVPWIAGEEVPLFFDLCLDIIAQFDNVDASGVESGQTLNLSQTLEFEVIEIRGFDEGLGEEVVIPGATLELQDPVTCMCNGLSTTGFKPPMGKKKKLGSTMPVKFQLYFDGTEVTSQEQLDNILTEYRCETDCPRIRIFDVTNEMLNVELPEDDIEDNVGDADAGDCFRFSDGNWIFNLRLGSAFDNGHDYVVDVVIGECVLEPGNYMFQIK